MLSKLCLPANEYVGMSVDDLQEIYDNTLCHLLDRHAPRRSVRKRYQPLTPWFDSECAASKRKSRVLGKKVSWISFTGRPSSLD